MALRPACLFDGHGTVILGEAAVTALLRRKLDFLLTIQERALAAAGEAQTLREITRKVFDRRDLVDLMSIGEGWLSLLTASNFTRSQFLKSFLRAAASPPPASRFSPPSQREQRRPPTDEGGERPKAVVPVETAHRAAPPNFAPPRRAHSSPP